MLSNGTERLDSHGGRRLTVPGVPGIVEIVNAESKDENGNTIAIQNVITNVDLSPDQQERLDDWLKTEWPRRKN